MPSDAQTFMNWFIEAYASRRPGSPKYRATRKDMVLVNSLLKVHDVARLKYLALMLLTTDDPWIAETERNIGILSYKANWLEARLRAAEAKNADMRSVRGPRAV